MLIASSTGGHFTQVNKIAAALNKEDVAYLVEKHPSIMPKDDMYFLNMFNRKENFVKTIIANTRISFHVLRKTKPKYIISTGAGAVIPCMILGKLMGSKIIFIESFAKVKSPTLTGRLMYFIADRFYVQWPDMQKVYKKAIYRGGLY
ncbi:MULTISPECIES: PssD/Cps14F family polysaccharide biosynthesis glycosyltransferase [Metabacillus]|uniref:PssD/Cps14F family polysaccharide biosynthesis glycosyltransferase n=1 Tax=Metabacillus hrfriensis TaxID=3048891 RepID=A0ACD4RIP1_9BACI|nr:MULTISPECIES: PssD/Cps14F family polysaccharide biosynthesis glycosyltransferase [Metabacillus]WHZ60364.1 PssD/Cps14F family polysaccharide biosynthesis glycosyltransferase [Metabacillus sp. CT-WN-B3]